MTKEQVADQFLIEKQIDFLYQGKNYIILPRKDDPEKKFFLEKVGDAEYRIPSYMIRRDLYQALNSIKNKGKIEEKNSMERQTDFWYQGKHYVVFKENKDSQQKSLFEEVSPEQYKIAPASIWQDLYPILQDTVLQKVKTIRDKVMVVEEPEEELKEQVESKAQSEKKSFFRAHKLVTSAFVLSFALALYVAIKMHATENIYNGLSHEELLDEIPENSHSCEEILLENFFEKSEEFAVLLSIEEQEGLMERIERFASYLSEEEQQLLKYQLSKTTFSWDGLGDKLEDLDARYIKGAYGGILYIKPEVLECRYQLEYALCEMMESCYLNNGDDYFVFHNQRFRDHKLPLGYNFSYYNNLMFIREHYPEYREECDPILEKEEALYYKLVLLGLDSNLTYLPFNYQMEDVIKAYQEIDSSEQKVNEFLSNINIIQRFPEDKTYSFFEYRHMIIQEASDYFIKRESKMTIQYFRAILLQLLDSKKNKEPLEDFLVTELASHYQKFASVMDQINRINPIKVCEYSDFKRPYENEFLPEVYKYGQFIGLISKEKTEEQFISDFYEKVLYYEQETKEEINYKSDRQKQKIEDITHYPISTQK